MFWIKKMERQTELTIGIGIIFLFLISFISFVNATPIGCGDEVERATDCAVRTPPITCSTYSIFNASGNFTHNSISMNEISPGSGVYNFTFNANGTGIHTVVLCDNTSTQIDVETTDETDLGTILSNQATLQNNIETVNQTVKDQAAIVNASIRLNVSTEADDIITNLTNSVSDLFSKLDTINESILTNVSLASFATTVSTADQQAIGLQCAQQVLGTNVTIIYGYNKTSFSLENASYNYTSIGIFINESYNYDNESFLDNVTRRDHLG